MPKPTPARKRTPVQLEVEQVAIDDLTLDSQNSRQHPLRNQAAIIASLRRFGQQKPIVINAQNMVVAGNGTLQAAIELGWPTIACVRSKLSKREIRAFAIADNRTSELAEWDMEILIEQLKEIDAADHDLLYSAGFNDGEMAALFGGDEEIIANDPDAEWDGMPEYEQDNLMHRTIKVHFANDDDVERFAKLVGQSITEKTKYIWFPEVDRAQVADRRYVSNQ